MEENGEMKGALCLTVTVCKFESQRTKHFHAYHFVYVKIQSHNN